MKVYFKDGSELELNETEFSKLQSHLKFHQEDKFAFLVYHVDYNIKGLTVNIHNINYIK